MHALISQTDSNNLKTALNWTAEAMIAFESIMQELQVAPALGIADYTTRVSSGNPLQIRRRLRRDQYDGCGEQGDITKQGIMKASQLRKGTERPDPQKTTKVKGREQGG